MCNGIKYGDALKLAEADTPRLGAQQHKMLNQCWFIFGPPSIDIGPVLSQRCFNVLCQLYIFFY